MKKNQPADGVVVVKKYANRRLYNTETSSYITLDHLAAMTREGRDFRVVDAKTDEDITHNVLTQIIMDEEGRGEKPMLPVPFLRQLIAMYGDSMQNMVPGYLEASMDSFRNNQAQFKSAVEGAFANTPFADIAKRNMAMFETAAGAFKTSPANAAAASAAAPSGPSPSAASGPSPSAASGLSHAAKDEEIAALRAELARMQDKVDKIAG